MIDQHLFKLDGAGAIVRRLAVLEVLQAFLIIGQALSLSMVLTILWQGKKPNWLYLLLFALCFTSRQLNDWFQDKMLDHYSNQESEKLRQKVLSKVFIEGQGLVQKQGTGSLINMALDGIDEVRN